MLEHQELIILTVKHLVNNTHKKKTSAQTAPGKRHSVLLQTMYLKAGGAHGDTHIRHQ